MTEAKTYAIAIPFSTFIRKRETCVRFAEETGAIGVHQDNTGNLFALYLTKEAFLDATNRISDYFEKGDHVAPMMQYALVDEKYIKR